MNSARKPIVFTFNGVTPYTQMSYKLYLYSFVYNDDIEVYRGRCISDGSGQLTIPVDSVVRDYIHQSHKVWRQGLQNYVPAALADFGTERTPDDYILSTVMVVVYDEDGIELTRDMMPFWYGWLLPWQNGELVYETDQVANLAMLGNGIVPHLPPVSTGAMWLEVVLQWLDSNGTHPELGTVGTRIELLTNGQGCYDMAFTLRDFFNEFSNGILDGGTSDSLFDGDVDGGDSESIPDDEIDGGNSENEYTVTAGIDLSIYYGDEVLPVAHIDTCASPYYVAWMMPNGGWMCWGFDGNVTNSATQRVATIQDTLNADRVTGMDTQATFNLYTGFLIREEYNMLTTLMYTREVYVYDVARDKGTWCSVEDRNMATAGNMRWRNVPLNVTLKELLHVAL